jgi:hypothetical protein
MGNSTCVGKNLRIRVPWSVLRTVEKIIGAPVQHPFLNELRLLHHASAARDGDVIGVTSRCA